MSEDTRISRSRFIAGAAGAALATTGAGTLAGAAGAASDAKKPILLGLPVPLSGPYANDGDQMKKGAQLAIEEINRAGGVGGRKLKAVMIDMNMETPDGIGRTFTNLIGQKVDAIATGYFNTLAGQPSNDLVARYGCPFLHANTQAASRDLVQKDPKKYGMIFQVDPPETYYGIGFVPFLNALEAGGRWKPKSHDIFLVASELPYSQGIANQTIATAKAGKKWNTRLETVLSPITDWGPVLGKIQSAKPAVIMICHSFPADNAAFVKQFAANPTNSLTYLQYAPSVPQFMELAGDAANGHLWATVSGRLPDARGKKFAAAFKKKFGDEPGLAIASLLYDMVYILAAGWRRVPNTRNFAGVSKHLRSTGFEYRGVNGGYYFHTPGQTVLSYPTQTKDASHSHPHLFFQIQNGKSKVVAPAPFTEAKFQLAPWQK